MVLNANEFYSDFRAISQWMLARNDFGHWMTIGRKGGKQTGIGIPTSFVRSVISEPCDLEQITPFSEPSFLIVLPLWVTVRMQRTKVLEFCKLGGTVEVLLFSYSQ